VYLKYVGEATFTYSNVRVLLFASHIHSQVLVPPIEHVDRPGELCDYGSWRGRGWCRLELSGAALARTRVRIMIVKSSVAQPEFQLPGDALFLSPGTGTYVS
jgi:hypothetical protein